MWEITWTLKHIFRDHDNYDDNESGEIRFSIGNTVPDAFDDVIKQLDDDDVLDMVVEAQVDETGYEDDCYKVDIHSINWVVEPPHKIPYKTLQSHPPWRFLMKKHIEKTIKDEKEKRDQKLEFFETQEKEQLLSLMNKYPNLVLKNDSIAS